MTLFSYEQGELENKKCPCGTEAVSFESINKKHPAFLGDAGLFIFLKITQAGDLNISQVLTF